jgi:capsular polysaccharide biosynthesis protein
MTAASEPTRPKLAWALREYIWFVVGVVVVTGGLAAFLGGSGAKDYKTNALVVATDTSLSQSQLPRLATAVFNSGAVASSVIQTEHLDITPEQLIPGRVSMVPFSDTVLFQVNATGSSAEDAANLANDAAAAFVKQMSAAGRFVGTFKVFVPARQPAAPSSSPRSPVVLFFFGAIGGLAISLVGLVGLLALRRPLTSEAEVEQVAHLPVLGTLFVSKHRKVDPAHVSGMRRVIRSLQSTSDGARALAMVPCDADWELGETVSQLLATDRTVRYVTCDEFGKPATNGSAEAEGNMTSGPGKPASNRSADAKAEPPKAPPAKTMRPLAHQRANASTTGDDAKSSRLTIVGGFAAAHGDDVPEAVFDADARVLVVWIGTPESSVVEAARRFAVGELNGIVCLDHRRH